MPEQKIKEKIHQVLNFFGIDLQRLNKKSLIPGTSSRPVGRMDYLLADLKQRGLSCFCIMDVGANSAAWSRLAIDIFRESAFILIEPQIEMKSELEKFCSEFGNARYFLCGAGARKEQKTLTIWEDLKGSSVLPAPDENLFREGRQRKIEIVRIDDIIREHNLPNPDLMKLDIQGFELEALKGADSTFGHTEVYIMEVSLFSYEDVPGLPEFADVIEFMNARNYVVYDFPGFLRRPSDGALGQCDICFVKKDGLFRKSRRWD